MYVSLQRTLRGTRVARHRNLNGNHIPKETLLSLFHPAREDKRVILFFKSTCSWTCRFSRAATHNEQYGQRETQKPRVRARPTSPCRWCPPLVVGLQGMDIHLRALGGRRWRRRKNQRSARARNNRFGAFASREERLKAQKKERIILLIIILIIIEFIECNS